MKRNKLIKASLAKMLKRQKGLCSLATCGQPVGKGRSSWCSDACVQQYKVLAFGTLCREAVYERDGGHCQICLAPVQLYTPKTHIRWRLHGQPIAHASQVDLPVAEIDHILPIVEGGEHRLENLRTLCRTCHLSQTAALRTRMAGKKVLGPVSELIDINDV